LVDKLAIYKQLLSKRTWGRGKFSHLKCIKSYRCCRNSSLTIFWPVNYSRLVYLITRAFLCLSACVCHVPNSLAYILQWSRNK
jgi:hypothetical protein